MKPLCYLILLLTLSIGCERNSYFDKNIPIDCFGWKMTDTLLYVVDINDVNQKYDLSINIRHRDIYEFMNIYLNLETILPNGEIKKEIVSIPLCDESGVWQGKCSGDICYQRVYLMKRILFPVKGKYLFKLNHEMRIEKLKNIFDVGLRIDHSVKKVYKENE